MVSTTRNSSRLQILFARCWCLEFGLYFCWDDIEASNVFRRKWNWSTLTNIPDAGYTLWCLMAGCVAAQWLQVCVSQICCSKCSRCNRLVESRWFIYGKKKKPFKMSLLKCIIKLIVDGLCFVETIGLRSIQTNIGQGCNAPSVFWWCGIFECCRSARRFTVKMAITLNEILSCDLNWIVIQLQILSSKIISIIKSNLIFFCNYRLYALN